MAEREVPALEEGTPQLKVPQTGHTYLMPRDVRVVGDIAVSGTVDGRDVAMDGAVLDTALQEGKQTMWVPAAAMRPTVSNGCAAITDVETTAGRPDITGLVFVSTSDEHAQFQVEMPKSWDEGTLTYKASWESSAVDTDGLAWALQAVAVSDGETIDVAYGTAIVVTDDAQSAAEKRYVTAESAALTVAGAPAFDDVVYFRVFRDVSDANDDMVESATLKGIRIFYTTDAANDA